MRAAATRTPSRIALVSTAVAIFCMSSAAARPTASTRPVTERLPDLVALQPYQIYEGPCDAYEQVEEGAARCLRYDTVVANIGTGPLELRYRADQIGREQRVQQRIYGSDGSFRDRFADTYELHPTHAHFHYANFAVAELWAADQYGRLEGKTPLRTSRKAGFCLTDSERYPIGRRPTPRRYLYPDDCYPTKIEGQQVAQINGLSRGWMDTYAADLTGQYVEISDIPDGYYVLKINIDPLGTLVESSDENNTSSTFLVISQGTARVSRSEGRAQRR